jgi:choline transport protein
MLSRAPTSGGQYHWVSEFTPARYQKFLSYAAGRICTHHLTLTQLIHLSGWMSSLGWLASVTSAAFVVTTQVQAMINVTNAEYAFTTWQYTLIMLAFMIVTIFFNTWGARILPMLETISLLGHIAGFLITGISLWGLCRRNSAAAVFTEEVNNGGWSNTGTACLVSQVTVMFCNLGSDSVVHICESLKFVGLDKIVDSPSSGRS